MPDNGLPEGWTRMRLGELLQLKYGTSLPEAARLGGNVPVVGSAGVVGAHSTASVKGPGIVVGRKGSIGDVTWMANDFWPIDTTYYVDPVDGKCDLRWAFQLLQTLNLPGLNRATGVPGLSRDDVHAIVRAFPPQDEQCRIAKVLDSIDGAIEKTEVVIAATERLRSALLGELLARGVPGWHTEWKQVPGIGTIPACWDVVRLGEIFVVQLGKMLSPKAKTGRGRRAYLTNRNVRWGGFDFSDVPEMDFDDREFEKFRLWVGDLLVCEGGEVGRAAIWEGAIDDCCYQKALHRVRPRGQDSTHFLQAFLAWAATTGYLNDFSETTSIPHLTAERLNRMRIPRPRTQEQQIVVDTLLEIQHQTHLEECVLQRLRDLKTRVAQALLFGRVRVGGR